MTSNPRTSTGFVPRRARRRDGGRAGALIGYAGALAVVGVAVITVVGRQVSAPTASIAAAVAFLPYLYAVLAAALFLLWALFPDRRSLPSALVTTVALAAAIWGPTWSARGVEGLEGQPVRVMSWNLRRMWGGPADGGDARSCTIAAIQDYDPDVIALQEVSAVDVEGLEAELGMRCAHHAYLSSSGSKRGGLAACARGGWSLKSGKGIRFVDHEDWYYVVAEVERRGSVFNLLAVHLSPYEYVAKKIRTGVRNLAQGDADELQALQRDGTQIVKGQANQAQALIHRMERFEDPTVVAGDFNSTRDAALHASLRRHLTDVWERGGQGLGGTVELFGWLPLRIDFVYATKDLPVARASLPDPGCSDHRPVVADLVLAKP